VRGGGKKLSPNSQIIMETHVKDGGGEKGEKDGGLFEKGERTPGG